MSGHLRSLSVDVDRSPAAMLNYQAAQTIERSGGNPSGVLELLETVIRKRSWEKVRDADGEPFGSFLAFVQASRDNNGLGTTKDALEKLIEVPHRLADSEWRERGPALRQAIRSLLDEEQRAELPNGGDRKSEEFQRDAVTLKRNSPDHHVARLKRDANSEDKAKAAKARGLLDDVLSGEITRTAAAKQMGWRPPRVDLTKPDLVAASIRKHWGDDQITQLVACLIGAGDASDG